MQESEQAIVKRTLSGKVALVTGAGGRRGIGRSTALRLAQEGADIVVVDIPWSKSFRAVDERGTWKGVHSVVEELQALGVRALGLEASVAIEAEVQGAVHHALGMFGQIDILVANAAARPGLDRVPVTDLKEEELRRVLDVNLIGSFFCCKAVGQHMMQRQQGAVAIVSSQSARIGKARLAAYAASKFGQTGLMQAFAHEMGPYGVRVNAVCPGLIDTARVDWSAQTATGSGQADERDRMVAEGVRGIPLGRIGTPEDVAATIAFLCSDDARHITGQSIGIDGGSRM
jgi:NAD(P)-dependent dehydrogenase (short-subunit alcohol dehydrogenase family)